MNNVKEQLQFLADHYETTRRAGHTQTMIDGVRENPDAIVIVPTFSSSDIFKRRNVDNAMVSLLSLDRLRGVRPVPIAIDNAALYVLFRQASLQLDAKDKELKEALVRAERAEAKVRSIKELVSIF